MLEYYIDAMMHRPTPASEPRSLPSAEHRQKINVDDQQSSNKLGTHLLEQQLRRVWNRQLRHLFRALAVRAPAVVPHKPALFARVHGELVRREHESLEEELRRAVADEAVALHFAEAETAFTGATLCGLASERRTGSTVSIVSIRIFYNSEAMTRRTEHERAFCP